MGIDGLDGWRPADGALGMIRGTAGKRLKDKGRDGWRSRIVGHGEEIPDKLLANARNWRIHNKRQQDALASVLDRVGWVQNCVVNRRTGYIVDGHLRVALAIRRGEPSVPVVYVDLSEEEEQLVLATLDPIGAMADADKEILDALLGNISNDEGTLNDLLGLIQAEVSLAYNPSPNWRNLSDTSLVRGDTAIEHYGYDGASVWSRTGDMETRAAPYYLSLPINPAHQGDNTPGKEHLLQRYSRSPFREMENIVRTYMRQGDYFLEACAGWWTFSCAAAAWGYKGVGIDIWDLSLAFGRKQLRRVPNGTQIIVQKATALSIPYAGGTFDFIYCNPPFWQLEKYSQSEDDLGSVATFEEWRHRNVAMLKELRRVAKPGSLIVTVIADYRQKGYLIPLHRDWITMGEEAGLALWDLAVQPLRSQQFILWRQAWNNRRTVKAHEYIIVFRAPGHGNFSALPLDDNDPPVIPEMMPENEPPQE